LEVGLKKEVKTAIVTEGHRSGEGSTSPIDMEALDGMGFAGPEEGSDDDIHFTMKRLLSKNDVSPMSNDLLPNNLGNISPNFPWYFITTLINFYLS